MAVRFHSTRGGCEPVSLADALCAGLAPDGGLYVPERFPRLEPGYFDGAVELTDIARLTLAPWFQGDELEPALAEICEEALTFPVPVRSAGQEGPALLELFHGPTAAFKDVGARFLAGCLTRLERVRTDGLTILVATSGDTGGAVAAAFEGQAGVGVAILFPGGLVSPRQEHQLCCWEEPIVSLRVARDFDACQDLVKAALGDEALRRELRLSSANSISIGRLLPQTVYYAATSLEWWRRTGRPANYIIPTGNLGNAVACTWAQAMGLPVGRVVLAVNENKSIPDFLRSGRWAPAKTVPTLASAMDVGNPSNMERLRHLVPDVQVLRTRLKAFSVSDEKIRENIGWAWRHMGRAVCPHTATGIAAWSQLQADDAASPGEWIVAATAHPAKFEGMVEPIIGEAVPVPDNLSKLLDRPVRAQDLEPKFETLVDVLRTQFG